MNPIRSTVSFEHKIPGADILLLISAPSASHFEPNLFLLSRVRGQICQFQLVPVIYLFQSRRHYRRRYVERGQSAFQRLVSSLSRHCMKPIFVDFRTEIGSLRTNIARRPHTILRLAHDLLCSVQLHGTFRHVKNVCQIMCLILT